MSLIGIEIYNYNGNHHIYKKRIMNKILLGEEAESFLRVLYIQHYKHKTDVKGGIFSSEINNIYTAYDCSNQNETFVEDFDDIVEAAKYANGVIAKTIGGYEI